jgi:hypothetical protein
MIDPSDYQNFYRDYTQNGLYLGLRFGQAFLKHFGSDPDVAAIAGFLSEEMYPHEVIQRLIDERIILMTHHYQRKPFDPSYTYLVELSNSEIVNVDRIKDQELMAERDGERVWDFQGQPVNPADPTIVASLSSPK